MSLTVPVNTSDNQIMQLAELTSFSKLIVESRPRMLAMIERRTDDKIRKRRCAGDVYQQACFKANRRWSEFPDSGMTEIAWLYRIVLDCLLDDRDFHIADGRNAYAEDIYPDRSSMQFEKGLRDPNPGPQTEAQRREEAELRRQRVARILMLLSPSHREVLCMRYFDEVSHREIGQILGITEDAARKRFSRALVEFHFEWIQQFGSPGSQP